MTREQYESLKLESLRGIARTRGLSGCSKMKKADLIEAMLRMDAAGETAEEKKAPVRPENTSAAEGDDNTSVTVKAENIPADVAPAPVKAENMPADGKTSPAPAIIRTKDASAATKTAAGTDGTENAPSRRRGRPRKDRTAASGDRNTETGRSDRKAHGKGVEKAGTDRFSGQKRAESPLHGPAGKDAKNSSGGSGRQRKKPGVKIKARSEASMSGSPAAIDETKAAQAPVTADEETGSQVLALPDAKTDMTVAADISGAGIAPAESMRKSGAEPGTTAAKELSKAVSASAEEVPSSGTEPDFESAEASSAVEPADNTESKAENAAAGELSREEPSFTSTMLSVAAEPDLTTEKEPSEAVPASLIKAPSVVDEPDSAAAEEPRRTEPASAAAAPSPGTESDITAAEETSGSEPVSAKSALPAEAEPGNDASRRSQQEGQERTGQKTLYLGSNSSFTRGILEVLPDGFGFLRSENFLSGDDDVYVSPSQIRRFNLKTGDMIDGIKRDKGIGDKNGALLYVSTVNDFTPDQARRRPAFENMTPVFPYERIRLEQPGGSTATRIVDLIIPIGKGQRGMIVSPPKAGKTTLLKDIAKSILTGTPDAHLIILLVDERPEEVTDMKESVTGRNVEVIYSTFDEQPEHHMRVAEMVIERARRLVEHHQDVIILLDSITRLTRAYNLLVPPSGRTLSGGLDPAALYAPKRFFGAARKMREGGSLTILATALVDTGSKMDDVVYEEFKGTGNMELILDRKLQERRIFPAIDITRSGTRREDLLLTPDELKAVYFMRRRMNGAKPEEAIENILNAFARSKSNEQVVNSVLAKWSEPARS